jgi:hypothetical protein
MKSLLGEITTWPKKMSMTALIAITVTNEEKAKQAGHRRASSAPVVKFHKLDHEISETRAKVIHQHDKRDQN